MTIQHTYERLLVDDFAGQFRFYRDVMGFEPVYGDEHDGAYAEFDTGKPALALFRRDLMAQAVNKKATPILNDTPDRHSLIFQVECVDDATATLKARGAAFVTEPHDRQDWGIRVAHFRDADGNLLEINAPLSR